MNKRNYQKELDNVIKGLGQNTVPTLLLHVCCAPCSSYCIEYLSEYFRITVFFYNPNLDEMDEYERRKAEEKRFIAEFPARYPVTFLEGRYNVGDYLSMVKGMETLPEGRERCVKCFEMRLKETAETAKALGMDYFTTTLTISPMKNADLLNTLGERIAEETGTCFLPSDFKKRNGFLRSTQLSKEYHLYRQDYCGCTFSKRNKEET